MIAGQGKHEASAECESRARGGARNHALSAANKKLTVCSV